MTGARPVFALAGELSRGAAALAVIDVAGTVDVGWGVAGLVEQQLIKSNAASRQTPVDRLSGSSAAAYGSCLVTLGGPVTRLTLSSNRA